MREEAKLNTHRAFHPRSLFFAEFSIVWVLFGCNRAESEERATWKWMKRRFHPMLPKSEKKGCCQVSRERRCVGRRAHTRSSWKYGSVSCSFSLGKTRQDKDKRVFTGVSLPEWESSCPEFWRRFYRREKITKIYTEGLLNNSRVYDNKSDTF